MKELEVRGQGRAPDSDEKLQRVTARPPARTIGEN
jgi:hypothetical protein